MIFTCAVVRVVHFELVSDRTTEETAAAVVRFTCRRGVPTAIMSDNAPELEEAAHLMRSSVHDARAPCGKGERSWEQLEWLHYPARALHFGGPVETVIQHCKRALCKLVLDKEAQDLELTHALVVAEHLVNSRPLGLLMSDIRDPQ